jgi:hypothetical protein
MRLRRRIVETHASATTSPSNAKSAALPLGPLRAPLVYRHASVRPLWHNHGNDMTTDQAGSKATPFNADAERGNSGEGKDPGQGAQRIGGEGEEHVGNDATASKEEKDARAFDHPGKPVQPG